MGHFIFYFRASTFIDIHFWIFTASFFVTRRRLKKLIKCHSVRVFERYIGRFRVPLTLTLLIEQPKSFKTFEIFNIFEIQMKVMAFLNWSFVIIISARSFVEVQILIYGKKPIYAIYSDFNVGIPGLEPTSPRQKMTWLKIKTDQISYTLFQSMKEHSK